MVVPRAATGFVRASPGSVMRYGTKSLTSSVITSPVFGCISHGLVLYPSQWKVYPSSTHRLPRLNTFGVESSTCGRICSRSLVRNIGSTLFDSVSPFAVSRLIRGPCRIASLQISAYALSTKSRGHPESTSQHRIGGPRCPLRLFAGSANASVRVGVRMSVALVSAVTSMRPSSGNDPSLWHSGSQWRIS